jgi:hypothetical protein
MNLSNSTTQHLELIQVMEIYDSAYQTGYKEAITDLRSDIDEEPEQLASFCTDYIKTESVDFTNEKDFKEYMLQYSYRLLSQYIK